MLGLRAQVLKPWVLLPAISHSKARSQLASISASFLEVSDSVEDRIFCRKVVVLNKLIKNGKVQWRRRGCAGAAQGLRRGCAGAATKNEIDGI